MTLNSVNITRLEKAAVDNGFDLDRGRDGDWLVFGSSQASLQIWLTALGESLFLVALSRSDVFDGLLLAPHLDAAFDQGFITVTDDGEVVVAENLAYDARVLLGLDRRLRIEMLGDGHLRYLRWHRQLVFHRVDPC